MNDKIEIQITNPDNSTAVRELFMTYGLLNSLTSLIGDPDKVVMLETDPELVRTLITAVFIPRTPSGRISVNIDDYDPPGMSLTEGNKVIDWVKEHVLDFFIQRMQKSMKLAKEREDQMKEIGSLLTGLAREASKTSSSLPSV